MVDPKVEPADSVFREAHLRDYWKVVWQGRWTVAAVFLVVVGIAAVWSFTQTPVYRATAVLEVQPKAQGVAVGQDVSGMGAAGYGWFAEEKYHNTQVEIIKSRDVAKRVFETLDLDQDPDFEAFSDPINAFRQRVQVVPRRETGLIEISIQGADANRVTSWVNEVAHVYVNRNLERAQGNVEAAFEKIDEQFRNWEEDLREAEVERFLALTETSLDSEEQEEIVLDKLKTFNADLTKVQIELNQLEDTLQKIRDMQRRGADMNSLPEVAEDPTIKELARSKVELERRLESAKVLLRPGHPEYEEAERELAKVQQRIHDRVSVMLGTLQTSYDLLNDRERYLKAQIEIAEDDSLQVARSASQYGVAKTKSETNKRIVDLIYKTMNEIQVGLSMLSNNVSILDEATIPRYPIKPRKKLNLAIGAVLGLLLGVAMTFFLDYLDNTFRTPEDVEKHLGLAVLGVIPKIDAKDRVGNRTYKEAYQSLRTSVIFSSKNHQRRVILFTSTGPQEGKSSTVASLGRTLASAGDKVLIIDCDLRRPTQHVLHGLERDHGVTNYLAAPIDLTDWSIYVKESDPSSLHVLTCGPIPPSPPELLSTDRFTNLIASLRDAYDWVLIDSPPATSLADAAQLATVADMLVLVIQHNTTDRDVTIKTLQRLRAVNSAVAGAVLNNVDLERAYHKDYYYAGYYFEDGDTGSTKAKKKRKSEPKTKVG